MQGQEGVLSFCAINHTSFVGINLNSLVDWITLTRQPNVKLGANKTISF
jgi:hypothetical protein